ELHRSPAAHREVAGSRPRPRFCAGADLSLRSEPSGSAVAMDYMGQCRSSAAVARRIGVVLLLRRQLRQFQRDVRFARRGHRFHDLAMDFSDRDIAGGGAQRRDRTPDRTRHDDWPPEAAWNTRRSYGRFRWRGEELVSIKTASSWRVRQE